MNINEFEAKALNMDCGDAEDSVRKITSLFRYGMTDEEKEECALACGRICAYAAQICGAMGDWTLADACKVALERTED